MSALIFQIQSTLIVLLMIVGVIQKKNRNLHVKIMISAIIWDVLLILQIELSRGAINKASKVAANPTILTVHIALAITTVLFYILMFYTGQKMLKNDMTIRGKHKAFGITTLLLRIATYITSFWTVS